ncbi:MAG: PAS domain-containing protein [Pseudomonas sp.]
MRLSDLLHAHEHEALNHHAIVSATDGEGRIIYVNDKFCAVSGYSRAELIGHSHALLKSGMHGSQLYRDMWQTIKAGRVWQGELCNRRKNGDRYWVESTIVPLFGSDGTPDKYLSIRTDITRIKQVEMALRRQRELQNLLTDATALLLNTQASQMVAAVGQILARSGEFLGACCARLHLQGDAADTLGRSHGWAAPELGGAPAPCQPPLGELPWWRQRMDQGDALLLSDIAALPADAAAERALLARQGCRALFALPLRKNAATIGYLLFAALRDQPDWVLDEVSAFSVLADAFAGAISRYQAEHALALHHERLRRSQIHANIGTWDWDVRTGHMFWTERTAPLLGFPEGDLETTYGSFLLAVHPEDRAQVLDAVDSALRNGESYEIEHRVVWPDGTVRWLLKSGAVVRGAESDALHMLGIVQDIDSRKRTELALVERERQLREAQAIAHMGSWEYDVETFELICSDETRRIFAFAADEGLDTYIGTLHGDDRAAVRRANKEALATGHFDVSCRIFTAEGALRHVHILANLERSGRGRVARYTGTVQDISDRIEAQARLRETEQRFSFAVEGAGDGVWEWDVPSQHMTLSSHCETMLGYPAGEVPPEARFMTAGIHPEDLAEVETVIEDLCAGRRNTCALEVRLRCRDGTYKWVLTRGIVVARDEDGFATRMIGINSDVSERKRVEQALITAREEADRANRAKSEFLSSMSHELRTPMNAILGFGQLLETDTQLDEEQHDNVQEILKAGHHLLELINEVLDLAKVESGRIELSMEPLDVASVAEECLSLVAAIAGKSGIALRCDVPDGLMVRADRTRLKQALLNLLSNAIKYNRPGGAVTLGAEHRAGSYMRLAVADTGPGIAAQRLPELFQPFNRLDAENSEVEGTGIGLTITERLVEMMGGVLGVESDVGVGSTFWIELPLALAVGAASPIPAPAQASATGGGVHGDRAVLYIEDNPANLKLLAQMIARRPGIALLCAESPEAGIEMALSQAPDLILLDINMPGLDGYQVLDVLRADPALRTIPVAAVTANAMPQDVLRGMAAGFDDYLTKPLEMTRLFAVLDRFLAKSISR